MMRRLPWREAFLVVGVYLLALGWSGGQQGDAPAQFATGAACLTIGALALYARRARVSPPR